MRDGDAAVLRRGAAREPADLRFHRRQVHVPERAPREALRHRRRDGPGVPPRRPHDRSAQRRLHARQRADRVELSDADVGRPARQIPARERPELAAASAARRRAGARRRPGGRGEVAPRADRSSTAPMPLCASCHAKMDPLGFALENYDAIGHWRTEDGKLPLDVSGTLPNGKDVFRPGRAEGASSRSACRPSRGASPRRC